MHVWPTMSNPTPNTFCFSVVSFRKQIKKLDSKTSYEKHCAFKSEPCVCGTISKVKIRCVSRFHFQSTSELSILFHSIIIEMHYSVKQK